MHQSHPAHGDQGRPRRPAPVAAATASPPGRQLRELENTCGWSRGERLRFLWYRLRLTVAEMNYANRRLFELGAPRASGDRRR